MAQIKTKFIEDAAITAAKLGTVTDGVTLDQSGSGSTIEVKAGGISNTQVNAAAAIAFSKLASLPNADILVGSAGNVATAVAMSGEASIVASGAVTLSNAAVIGKVLTGYTSGAGTVSASDSILTAIEKLNGNAGNFLPLAGGTMSGDINMGGHELVNASNVGIGIASPSANLHVYSTVPAQVVIENPQSSGNVTAAIDLVTNGVTNGSINARNNANNAFGLVSGLNLRAQSGSGDIGFAAGSAISGGASAPNVIMKASGNVGIGIALPLHTLDVNGDMGLNSNQIHNVADPSSAQDAMTLNYADTHYLALSGGTMTGVINANSHKITGVSSGTATGDALQWGQIGVANGIAGLDAGGKVPLSQLPSALMEFQGNWDPSTNTPALVDGTGTTGFTYWVSTAFAGPVSGLNDASMVNFQVGDLVIYNGTAWVLTTPAAGVQSVNGAQGAVTVNAINQLTGDATAGPASGSQSQALTLATVNGNVGSFGSSTSIPSFTVNAKGLITAASGNAVIAPAGTLSGTTLNATVVSSSLTSVGTIATGTWNGTTIAINHGGTGQTTAAAAYNALSPMTTTGDLEYEASAGTAARLAIGSTGQVLTVAGGIPTWASPASAPTTTEDILTLNGTDITNQYKDLNNPATGSSASVNSISLNVVGGPEQLKGTDYTVSLTGGSGGVTRITFAGDLATGGNAALVAGDILMVKYAY